MHLLDVTLYGFEVFVEEQKRNATNRDEQDQRASNVMAAVDALVNVEELWHGKLPESTTIGWREAVH